MKTPTSGVRVLINVLEYLNFTSNKKNREIAKHTDMVTSIEAMATVTNKMKSKNAL